MQNSQIAAPAAPPQKPLVSRVVMIAGVVVILLLTVLLGWGIIWLATRHPETIEALRDVMMIALALASCLFGVSLILITIMLIRLVNMLEFEIKPILQQTNETISAVRGTTTFVSKNVVKPVARATGFVAGVRRGVKILFGDPRRNLPD